jgi:fructose-bisphosphate aldolase class II/tagatose 1,6-diphosphate aldolase GatY/KbaY
MACVNFTEMLEKARADNYAIGAFNILDYNSMKAVVDGAVELNAPVIIQTSVKTVLYWGYKALVNWYRELAQKESIPVTLHLDHCKDLNVINNCIGSGWTSVMIDASAKLFEENIADTLQVVAMAQPKSVSVEAELGMIVGVEEDIVVTDERARLADPEKSEEFCRRTDIDIFAPAVGTAHGLYKGKPEIAFSLIEDIAARTGKALCLHGGTGLADDVFHRAIKLGCAKVNISTMLKHSFIDSFTSYRDRNKTDYNPLKFIEAQYFDMKETVKMNIRLFGSQDKAGV